MLYLWYYGGMLYGAYAVGAGLYVGLVIQPQLFSFFALVNILQVHLYGSRMCAARVAAVGALLVASYVGGHIGMWKACAHAVGRHQHAAVTVLGVLPATAIALGFLPEICVCLREQTVEMSNLFLLFDILGGVFSTISLAFDHSFDYVASITYLVVVLLDVVLVLMKAYYHARGTQGIMRRRPDSNAESGAATADPGEEEEEQGLACGDKHVIEAKQG
ncbi:hypothetical protein H4R18_000102 [Coemansia javaensis]|uniref:PQ-loop-domain-containing protein n=1 Tax=Coemansia javaensis TaxID=2761396 RepID=A0A9W8HKJ6_9FUNG|nr:hypothetical protein H4R18_000102 [Coemansia javaensis]